jgi:hypothetical protein
MLGAAVVYSGLILAFIGLILFIKPIHRLGIRKRSSGMVVAAIGILLVATGFVLPAPESRIIVTKSHLDEFVPAWQFNEFHSIRIAASPEHVYEAIEQVRADEIALFRTLTWIRRAGRQLPESILNAGNRSSLIDVATRSGFVRLADDRPRELVIGTVVVVPPGTRGTLTPDVFRKRLPPGFALAAMNFIVRPDGSGGSYVSTETRVFANSPSVRHRFAAYWRVIYPGSAIIRRMWLRAIARRATAANRK